MNIPMLRRLAETLEALPLPPTDRHLGSELDELGFSMRDFVCQRPVRSSEVDTSGHSCQTVACLAGWTCSLAANSHTRVIKELGTTYNNTWFEDAGYTRAADLLGIDGTTARLLFFPEREYLSEYRTAWEATPTEAARVVRHLIATGRVDWSQGEASA